MFEATDLWTLRGVSAQCAGEDHGGCPDSEGLDLGDCWCACHSEAVRFPMPAVYDGEDYDGLE